MSFEAEIETRTKLLGRAIAHLDGALNWAELGKLYCSEGGEDFFCEEQRDAIVMSGMEFAQELGGRLAPNAGASLYVGAAVFELLPALFECLVLERPVTLINLDQAETSELNRGLAQAASELGVELPQIETCELSTLRPASFDHVWMTSVLTDPEAFPALHDHFYEREGTELGTNRGDLDSEGAVANELVEKLLATATQPFWLTTTDEELPIIQVQCALRSLEIQIPETGRLSGIVGDPVLHCYVSSEAGNA